MRPDPDSFRSFYQLEKREQVKKSRFELLSLRQNAGPSNSKPNAEEVEDMVFFSFLFFSFSFCYGFLF